MNKPVIVYGEQGCGKTRNAKAIATHYRKSIIIDEGAGYIPWWNRPIQPEAVVLTANRAAALSHAERFGSIAVDFASLAASGVV
jgi:fructose-1,6-bisphosphatase/inositol monophosphatase family enzyme